MQNAANGNKSNLISFQVHTSYSGLQQAFFTVLSMWRMRNDHVKADTQRTKTNRCISHSLEEKNEDFVDCKVRLLCFLRGWLQFPRMLILK